MTARYLLILALAIAGSIRSPFFPQELTSIPLYALYLSALSAAQIMSALYLLTQTGKQLSNRQRWLVILLSGGSLAFSGLIALSEQALSAPALSIAAIADLAVCLIALIAFPQTWRSRLSALTSAMIVGLL